MRRLAIILIWFVLFASAAGSVAAALWLREQAHTRDLSRVIEEPAPPQAPAPLPAPEEVDGRILALRERHAKGESTHPERGDGAILVWASPPNTTFLRAAFASDMRLVISATSSELASAWRVFGIGLSSSSTAETSLMLSGTPPLVASSHRPYDRANGGQRLCYSAPGNLTLEVWCLGVDGAPRRMTTHDGKEDLIEASVSPDNNWIVFEVNTDRVASEEPRRRPAPYDAVGNGRGKSAIWKIGMNGGGIVQLTRGADDRFPTWSSDGETILFQRRMPDGNWDMFVMDADGKDPQPLLRTYGEDELWPSVRSGRSQVVASVRNADGWKIRLFDVVTKASTPVASASAGPETFPSVSPDGKLVSFLAPVDAVDPSRLGVWIAPLAP